MSYLTLIIRLEAHYWDDGLGGLAMLFDCRVSKDTRMFVARFMGGGDG